MKNLFIKIPLLVLCTSLTVISCKTQTPATENLPKDISERPADESSQKYDQAQLDKLKATINSEISKEKCTGNTDEWASAPMGSKACGGPKSYIAYPKKLEASILPKIEDYNNKEKDFNTKFGITSDCTLVGEPAGIRCVNGKAEVIYPAQ
ncbi:hypothetical protein IW15_20680 [Chryseobacterium soli]|uniref:Lipoprotein n=1 Tax=Chryseobacterium soli TaxID=445961 RepID=A0A086A0H9_9FLAO|nr:hypothetical protein [Chryseobacterium soli]KFF10193.1 hypothetical protein IW15_20680 [Chryseobacterium soli]